MTFGFQTSKEMEEQSAGGISSFEDIEEFSVENYTEEDLQSVYTTDDKWDLDSELETYEFENEFEEIEDLSQPTQRILNEVQALRKYPFKLKQDESGNILTVHNTVKNVNRALRVRFAACCFNDLSNKLVVIDRRGDIFVFDFVNKLYWRLTFRLAQATLVHASPLHRNYYIVTSESGNVYTIDVDKSIVSRQNQVGSVPIEQISWGNRLKSTSASNTLLRYGPEAVLLNLETLRVSHKLEFDHTRHTLKFAGFMPNSDQFFTCYTNDSVHVWSTMTMDTVRIVQPIKARDRKLRFSRATDAVPEFILHGQDDDHNWLKDELAMDCEGQHFADGMLITYSFSPDGNKLCLSTLDGYLMVLNSASHDLEKLFKLRDFIIKQMCMLPTPKERILFAITAGGVAIMLDLEHTEHKLIVQHSNAVSLKVSRDGKLLCVVSKCGEVNVWSTCRLFNLLHAKTNSIIQLRAALKMPRLPGHVDASVNQELRQLLKRNRLEAMLREFGCFPEKYRFLIWTSLLELPCNSSQYQALLKLGQPRNIRQQAQELKIKNEAERRAVIKVWSCLSHWCKVFGYSEITPHFIYPFVKQLPKNGLVVFELLVSLLLNHLELCFEFYPLPPENYLAMCENVLQRSDEKLSKFYNAQEVKTKDYAWSLVTNAFSEVLDEQQWLTLWDNIIAEPPYFIIFVIVAYNMLHREVIMRLPDKTTILRFFHEQNPVDVNKLICRARKLMSKCAANVHPKRFIPPFKAIPKGVYPKFVKYPSDWIAQQEEQSTILCRQNQEIDARIRHLEIEELQMMNRLENGLKQEEHARRIKEMESLYRDTLQREEERIACNRKMLLTYQLEVRQRKSEVMTQLQESEQRRQVLEMEKDIGQLMHNIERERRRHTQEMQFAEDEIRNQEMELLAQRYYTDTGGAPLAQKYYDNIQKMCQQRDKLQQNLREMTLERLQKPKTPRKTSAPRESNLLDIERSIIEIQREFSDIINSDCNSK